MTNFLIWNSLVISSIINIKISINREKTIKSVDAEGLANTKKLANIKKLANTKKLIVIYYKY